MTIRMTDASAKPSRLAMKACPTVTRGSGGSLLARLDREGSRFSAGGSGQVANSV